MTFRYRGTNQAIAKGERIFFLGDDKIYVRTSLQSSDDTSLVYNLKEVYDDAGDVATSIVKHQLNIHPANLEYKMSGEVFESVVNRLIPFPFDNFPANESPRMERIKFVGDANVYVFDPATRAPVVVSSGIYSFSIGFWGFVDPSVDPAALASLPGDGVTVTPVTVEYYQICTLSGSVVSDPITLNNLGQPIKFEITGEDVVVDTVPPAITAVYPSGFDVPLNEEVVITFDKNIVLGTGNIYLYNEADTLVETFDVTGASVSGAQLRFTPVVAQTNSTGLKVRHDAGIVTNTNGNAIGAYSGNAYAWITVAASGGGGGGPGTPLVDVIVTDLTALRNLLVNWQGNWGSTIPAGKTVNDDRVVGIDASTSGTMNLNNLDFSGKGRVFVRHVGTFTVDQYGVALCSRSHSGLVSMTGSKNLWMSLLDIRAPASIGSFAPIVTVSNTTDCGIWRCAIKGKPYTPFTTAQGTVQNGVTVQNTNTRFTILHNMYAYFSDGFLKFLDNVNQPHVEGNIGRFVGGDDITFAGSTTITDWYSKANYFARIRHVGGSVSAPLHNDAYQFNGSTTARPGPTAAVRWRSEYDVFYHGMWYGVAAQASTGGQLGWAAYYFSGGDGPSTGPHLIENALVLNAHSRGINNFNGGGLTANRNTAVQHNTQFLSYGHPKIETPLGDYNFASKPSGTWNTNVGPNGLLLNMGGDQQQNGINYNTLLPYFNAIPTDTTDLWDIRPDVSMRTHPDYAGAETIVGCSGLWAKLFNGDADVVLSKVGWPVATMWVMDFDVGKNFYNASLLFDANGNNA